MTRLGRWPLFRGGRALHTGILRAKLYQFLLLSIWKTIRKYLRWWPTVDRRRKESVHDPFNTADKFTVRNTTAINKQIVITHRVGHFRLCRLYWVTNETLESSQMRLWWIFTNLYTHSMTIPIIKLYQIKNTYNMILTFPSPAPFHWLRRHCSWMSSVALLI